MVYIRDGSLFNFTWQNGRQLASGTKGTTEFAYTYNADGLRTKKVVDGVTTEYYWAGSQLAAMTIDNGTTVKTLKFYYDAEGRPLCLDFNGTVYLYITNLQGDVVALADQYGEVIRYEYDAWGKPISTYYVASPYYDAMYYNPLRYRGYIYDNETGLYYLQSRYYDPIVGRFINADGYVSTGQGILGHNMFVYCGNNSVVKIDYTGEAWKYLLLAGVPIPTLWAIGLISEIKVTKDLKNGKGYETMEEAATAWSDTYSEKTANEKREYGAIILSKKIDGKTYYYTGKTRKGFAHTCWNSFVLGYVFHTGNIEGFIHTHPRQNYNGPSEMDLRLFRWFPGIDRQFIADEQNNVHEFFRDGKSDNLHTEEE